MGATMFIKWRMNQKNRADQIIEEIMREVRG
jgi:hypothetical protein